MDYNPFAAQQQTLDPQAAMAQLLMKQGMQPQQGKMVQNVYVPPPASQYASQLASALTGMQGMSNAQDGQRAQKILDTGMAQPAALNGFQKMGGWLGGLFGGGGA